MLVRLILFACLCIKINACVEQSVQLTNVEQSTTTASSMDNCLAQCRLNTACRFVTFTFPSSCKFYGVEAISSRASAPTSSFFAPRNCLSNGDEYCFAKNTKYDETTIRDFSTDNVQDCRLACFVDSQCRFFSFAKNTNICSFFSILTKIQTLNENFVSGPQECIVDTKATNVFYFKVPLALIFSFLLLFIVAYSFKKIF